MDSEPRAVSVFGRKIRLSEERWRHIEERHPNLAGWQARLLEAIARPDFVVSGRHGELVAVRSHLVVGRQRFLVVIYWETRKDGFMITAVLASDVSGLRRRGILWPKP